MSTYNVAFNSTLVSESPKGILVEMLWHVRSYYISNRQHGMRTLRLHSQHSTILISTCMLLHMHWYSLHTNIHFLNLHKIVILKKKKNYFIAPWNIFSKINYKKTNIVLTSYLNIYLKKNKANWYLPSGKPTQARVSVSQGIIQGAASTKHLLPC